MNTEVISKAAYSNGLQENGQDGVVFTMPASRKKFMSVYIRPDIDTLVFSRKFIEYNLMDENKVFPNIKKICIENGVREIKIKNSTFPNVEQVVSESSSFASGEMLIEVGLYNQYTLINTFIINFKPGNPTPLGMGRRALFLQKNKKISYFFTLS